VVSPRRQHGLAGVSALALGAVLAACSSGGPSAGPPTAPPSSAAATTAPAITPSSTTTTGLAGVLPTGEYTDGPQSSTHYVLTLTSTSGGALVGTVSTRYPDGESAPNFTFNGPVQPTSATSGTAMLTTQPGTASLTASYSDHQLVLQGCTSVLVLPSAALSCTFTYSG
jgi:hypothetical protein